MWRPVKWGLMACWTTCSHSRITLKKPQMPPAVSVSEGTLGSSCSSGKVMGDPVANPPVIAGCWTSGFVTTPWRHYGTLKKTNKPKTHLPNVTVLTFNNCRAVRGGVLILKQSRVIVSWPLLKKEYSLKPLFSIYHVTIFIKLKPAVHEIP